jgi:hypothetical protein
LGFGGDQPGYRAVEGASMSETGGQGMGGDGNRAADAMMMYTNPSAFLGDPEYSTLVEEALRKKRDDDLFALIMGDY